MDHTQINMMDSTTSPNSLGPQSPMDLNNPDSNLMMGGMAHSPGFGSSQGRSSSPSNANYPPLSGSKHFCTICGDRASGKHYGVYSCEGCKGFFKRTVRKELTYTCRENRECDVDKRNRNRCQYCRYMKCLNSGMRREAVQEERHRANNGRDSRDGRAGDNEVESSTGGAVIVSGNQTGSGSEMPIERILEAENIAEGSNKGSNNSFDESRMNNGSGINNQNNFVGDLDNQTTRKKLLHQLVDWAKHIPHFTDLKIDDQVILIRSGWNELLIAGFAFRSTRLNEGILWADGQVITRENAHIAGVGEIFDRVLVELVGKMKEMNMDKAELGCLRAIVLFNPDARGMDSGPSSQVETFREMVYSTLGEYTRTNYENEPSRFAKLLLRLPALRSIGLKCVEHLFFYELIRDEGNGNSNAAAAAAVNNGNDDSNSEDSTRSLDAFIKEILEGWVDNTVSSTTKPLHGQRDKTKDTLINVNDSNSIDSASKEDFNETLDIIIEHINEEMTMSKTDRNKDQRMLLPPNGHFKSGSTESQLQLKGKLEAIMEQQYEQHTPSPDEEQHRSFQHKVNNESQFNAADQQQQRQSGNFSECEIQKQTHSTVHNGNEFLTNHFENVSQTQLSEFDFEKIVSPSRNNQVLERVENDACHNPKKTSTEQLCEQNIPSDKRQHGSFQDSHVNKENCERQFIADHHQEQIHSEIFSKEQTESDLNSLQLSEIEKVIPPSNNNQVVKCVERFKCQIQEVELTDPVPKKRKEVTGGLNQHCVQNVLKDQMHVGNFSDYQNQQPTTHFTPHGQLKSLQQQNFATTDSIQVKKAGLEKVNSPRNNNSKVVKHFEQNDCHALEVEIAVPVPENHQQVNTIPPEIDISRQQPDHEIEVLYLPYPVVQKSVNTDAIGEKECRGELEVVANVILPPPPEFSDQPVVDEILHRDADIDGNKKCAGSLTVQTALKVLKESQEENTAAAATSCLLDEIFEDLGINSNVSSEEEEEEELQHHNRQGGGEELKRVNVKARKRTQVLSEPRRSKRKTKAHYYGLQN